MEKAGSKSCGPLRCIVTGWEHTGTTIVARLIKCHPDLFGGGEGGLLLAKTPAEFGSVDPFAEWLTLDHRKVEFWSVSQEGLQRIMSRTTWEEAYTQLHHESPLTSGTSYQIVDKTPRYIRHLCEILEKVPGVPCVVTTKNRIHMYASYCRKRRQSWRSAERHVRESKKCLREALSRFPDRIFVLPHERLIKDPYGSMRDVFRFIGLDWSDEYLNLDLYTRKWERATGQHPLQVGIYKINAENKLVFVSLLEDAKVFNGIMARHTGKRNQRRHP
jgi:hypothetical protein